MIFKIVFCPRGGGTEVGLRRGNLPFPCCSSRSVTVSELSNFSEPQESQNWPL